MDINEGLSDNVVGSVPRQTTMLYATCEQLRWEYVQAMSASRGAQKKSIVEEMNKTVRYLRDRIRRLNDVVRYAGLGASCQDNEGEKANDT